MMKLRMDCYELFSEQKGFTLVELLIAIMLIFILTLSLMYAYTQSLLAASNDNFCNVAVNLARQRLEEIKRYESLNLSDSDWQSYLNALSTSLSVDSKTYGITTKSLTTTDIPSLPNTVRAVRITITWTQKKQSQAVSYITYYLR
jgi:prepilin-type N-terminal cleavage/methylation domain-containing protein